ncbi:dienelactone hydrolase family protein [Synechococcus sp. A15-127]|nr:dienelactone hydrolase family protein [Synechococcus sp. A15-127]QNI93227.1 dienelactone hydrolase family protein [Synechococcus sp. A15-127]
MTISNSRYSDWVQVVDGQVPLRCWWAPPVADQHDIDANMTQKRVVIVLPEVFGVNAWVRGVADRLAAAGVPALAVPLFARTAPELDLAYETSDLAQGRRHKDATTTDQILSDLSAAIAWLARVCPGAEVSVVGFCFGGHAALLAATLPAVKHSFDFYGAGVSRMRPGGGPPSLALLPSIQGQLTCLCGTGDHLIPAEDRAAIQAALRESDPEGERFRYLELEGADHGFMCDARSSYNPEAARFGWQLLERSLA